MTYDEAAAYAQQHPCNGLIVRDPKKGDYHFVVGFLDHWQRVWETVARVEVTVTVRSCKG